MDLNEAREFIKENHRAVMMTTRQDGRPQMSPVAVGLDSQGRAIVSSRETAFKTKNLRRDPRVSLCVFVDKFFGPWIQIDGTAEVLSLPEALEPLVEYYKTTWGEHPDWAEYREAMVTEKRVLYLITLEHAGPDKQG